MTSQITFPRTLDEARNEPPDTWIDHFNYTDRDFPRMQADQCCALRNICYVYHWFRHAEEDADLGQVWAEFVEERTNGILGSWWEPSPGEAPLLALSQWAQHWIPVRGDYEVIVSHLSRDRSCGPARQRSPRMATALWHTRRSS